MSTNDVEMIEMDAESGETSNAAASQLSGSQPASSTIGQQRRAATDLSVVPTLFPAPVANLITALSTTARVSMRVTAFFIEAILESSQYTTRLSLASMRRILVAVVSSARRMYLVSSAALHADGADLLRLATGGAGRAESGRFLQVLDKYTNLGVYVIHHTFTLAELFAMSGFHLTQGAISSAHHAAQESVALFDSLFGSNESSRALSSIITLVRKEVLEDERFKEGGKGKIATVAALTRTMTAFACLQGATWPASAKSFKMKRLYDLEVEEEKTGASRKRTVVSVRDRLDRLDNQEQALAGPGPSTEEHRRKADQAADKSWTNWNGVACGGRQRAAIDADEQLLGQDDSIDEDEPFEHGQDDTEDASTRLYDRRRRLSRVAGDGLYEIVDEVTETCKTSQAVETIDREGNLVSRPVNLDLARSRGEEAMDIDDNGEDVQITISQQARPKPLWHTRSASTSSASSTESEWMEVDDLLGGPGPSAVGSDPVDTIIRITTNKLLGRKRIVRKVDEGEATEDLVHTIPDLDTLIADDLQDSEEARERPAGLTDDPTRKDDIAATSNRRDGFEARFPADSVARNIHRFMRYSSAAYGQSFLRILRLGEDDYNFASTTKHHANSWAFAKHTGIPIDCLLLSSYVGSTPTFGRKVPPLVHYIAVEHDLKAIVLTCRGTLGLSDVLVDLTCEYCDIPLEGADPLGEYYVHKGMYTSAVALTDRNSTVHRTLADALRRYPAYGLVITGHSLGGGVAALLSILLSMPTDTFLKNKPSDLSHPDTTTPFVTGLASGLPPGRSIHCYSYGPPAVASLDLAKYTQGLISSVVHGTDIVPCLSLGCLRDLRNVAITLSEEKGHLAEEIVARVVGLHRGAIPGKTSSETVQKAGTSLSRDSDNDALSDWMTSLIKTMRADMNSDKLYPPGTVYIIEYQKIRNERGTGLLQRLKNTKHMVRRKEYRVSLSRCDSVAERFREPLFTKTMLRDHLPSHYERATQLLCSSPLTEREVPTTVTGKSVASSHDVTPPEQA